MKKSEGGRFELVSWYSVALGCALVWILCSIPKLIEPIQNHRPQLAAVAGVGYLLVLLYVLVWKKKRDTKTLIELILLGGFLLRAAYVLAAPYNISGHDMGHFVDFDSDELSWGHLGYIDYIFKNHRLPDFDPRTVWSFSNPPGFYIVGSLMLGLSRLFHVEAPWCYESIQAVTLLFSCLTTLTMYRIFNEFSIRRGWLVLLTALVSFHPYFMIMAVSVNNDAMMTYLLAVAVLYTVRWCKDPSMKNILIIALALGLAMFAKLNGATVCFGIGAAFLYVFWTNRKDWKRFFLQFAAFLAVCAPIGLFWPVRNMVRFDMPFMYIQKLGANNWLRISDASVAARLGLPTFAQCFYPFLRFDNTLEVNVWIQTLRTALFDELWMDGGAEFFQMMSLLLLWASVVLSVAMNLMFVWSICKKGVLRRDMKILLAVAYAGMLLVYIKFCMDEPAISTMNYRYIPIALLFPCIGAGLWGQRRRDREELKRSSGPSLARKAMVHVSVDFVGLAVIVDICLILWSYMRFGK